MPDLSAHTKHILYVNFLELFFGVFQEITTVPRPCLMHHSWGRVVCGSFPAVSVCCDAVFSPPGYLIMTDDWFSEYVYEVVVDKKHVPEEILAVMQQEPIVLPAWDPMGALAK